MSANRVKSKQGSVREKSPVYSATVSKSARQEEFVISNVRCFKGEQRVPIRPITLLVGENSTGKTTFLETYQTLAERTCQFLDHDLEGERKRISDLMLDMSRQHLKDWEDLRSRMNDFGKLSGMFADVDAKTLNGASGVSQIYPILANVILASQKGNQTAFLIQHPEIYLHPKAQAALSQFFVESAVKEGHTFLVETHGDYIIDRVRICVSNKIIPPEDVVILYFEPQKAGNVKIHPIRLDEMANMRGAPAGYRKFFMEDGNRLLGFKKLSKKERYVRDR